MNGMKYILSALLVFVTAASLSAQEVYSSSGKPISQYRREQKKKQEGFQTSRIVFGGGMGLGIGTVTNISISPIVGYRITDKFTAGIGMGYQYLRIKDYYPVADPNTGAAIYKPLVAQVYSPSVWARYSIWRNIFAHVEYEHDFMSFRKYVNNTFKNTIESITDHADVPCLLVGAGARWPISDRVSFIMLALYDVIQDKQSPYYGNIALRFGVNAGF